MIRKCSTGHVGIEDSADGSVMLRSTSLVIMVVHENTGTSAEIVIYTVFKNMDFVRMILNLNINISCGELVFRCCAMRS